MSSLGLGIAGAGLVYGVVNSQIQQHKANQIQKNLKDPVYNIPPEFEENRNIARQMAQIGLPQQQYNNQLNNINQNQAAAISTLGRSANPGSSVASIVRQGDNATNSLNAEDAQARNNNQRYAIQENAALGNQELAKQQSDVFDKYTRDFNEMQAYKGASQQGLNSAIGGAQQLGMTALNASYNNPSSTQTMGQKLGNPTLSATIPQQQNTFQQPGIPSLTPQYYGQGWGVNLPQSKQYGLPYNWAQ